MSGEFRRAIRPEDMTKLQQIAEMMSRDSVSYARKIADSIDEPVAREVADILVRRITNPSAEYHDFANELAASTKALVHKLAVA